MQKRHLKLVVVNDVNNQKRGFWEALINWFNKPRTIESPFIVTHIEKKQIVQNYLTLKFAEYQTTTGTVGLFPLCEAMNEVDRLEKAGLINAYYRKIKNKLVV